MERRPVDFPKHSVQEMVASVMENRAWSKQLRINSRMLVNSRVAKLIDADDYAARRNLINENVAECKRREIVLLKEITAREREGYTLTLAFERTREATRESAGIEFEHLPLVHQ
jgi:hypothetical protein